MSYGLSGKHRLSSMEKALMLFSLLVATVFILSACAKQEPVYVEGTTNLRCDGVYRKISDDSDINPAYLRFFSEGGVTRCNNITSLSPKEAFSKMVSADGSVNVYGNVYKSTSFAISSGISISADGEVENLPDVTFYFQIQGGTISYIGDIGETLAFEVHSTINGKTFAEEYEFIQVDS